MAYHLTIRQGNLLEDEGADVIVNPSNTLLSLGSGVSAAFAAACGPQLQTLMSAARMETGSLSKGDVVATAGGACRRFDTVLHAAVMDYNPDAASAMPTRLDIEKILINIEAYLAAYAANHDRRVSLALPLMGTGVGGLDKRDVLTLYRAFFDRLQGFECSVRLYAHSGEDAGLMREVLED